MAIPAEDEIKCKPPRNTFLASAGGEVVTALREGMLAAAVARGITSVVLIRDHSRVFRDRIVVEVGQKLLKWAYDKVALGLGGQQAVTIADKPDAVSGRRAAKTDGRSPCRRWRRGPVAPHLSSGAGT